MSSISAPTAAVGTAPSLFGDNESPASALARYVSSEKFHQLPVEVVSGVFALVEDNIGCALGALATPESDCFVDVTRAVSGPAQAIGGGHTSVSRAVFCNSSLSNWLDFDDMYHYFLPFHLGCLIVPAALAVGQSINASAQEFLTAVAVAYEVTMRVGRSIGNGVRKGGLLSFYPPVAQLAASVAAAKLYGLDSNQIRKLFSIIAMDERNGPITFSKHDVSSDARLGMLKGNYGSLAQMGIWAVTKARSGLTGRPGLLESSLSDWYGLGLPEEGFESLTANLGVEYLIPQMGLKPTPACWLSQSAITAAWDALDGRHLDAAHVIRIRVFGVPRLQRTRWSNLLDAQFSIPCSLALAMSGIEPGPKWYRDGGYSSARILALAAKIVQEADSSAELAEIRDGRLTCKVKIEMKDGQVLEGACRAIRGSPENPLTLEQRGAKWAANTAHLPMDVGREIRRALQNLQQDATLANLGAALAAGSSL